MIRGISVPGGFGVSSSAYAIGEDPNARHNLGCVEGNNGRTERAIQHIIIAANMGHDGSLETVQEEFHPTSHPETFVVVADMVDTLARSLWPTLLDWPWRMLLCTSCRWVNLHCCIWCPAALVRLFSWHAGMES